MRYAKPTNDGVVPYSTVKIDGCSEAKLGFDFLSEQPSIGKRRYCNKVLVHECISVPEIEPMDAIKVEFMATSDPCYYFFEIFKTSDADEYDDPGIDLQLDDDDKTIGVIVNFDSTDTCGMPLTLAYKLYVYLEDGRVLVSNGTLCITPCCCGNADAPDVWTDINW